MADRRRRRRVRTSEDSEELSDGSEKEYSVGKESEGEQSEMEKPTVESEYESAEEEDNAAKKAVKEEHCTDTTEVQEEVEISKEELENNPSEVKEDHFLEEDIPEMHDFIEGETSGDLLDEEGGVEEEADIEIECEFIENGDDDILEEGEEYFEGEREQGDGEESATPVPPKEKVLDDDEDRRNPQYIPKKGSFYEHDDRLGSEHEEEEEPKETKEKEKGKKKKLWLDEGRWGHDMYREEEQGPKSKDELVGVYGYDIRNEDNAPRARRRRRYGRGPNKYTRNWQDEDAYFKAGEVVQGGRGRGSTNRIIRNQEDDNEVKETIENGPEDFPALPSCKTPPESRPVIVECRETEQPEVLTTPSEDVVKTLTFSNSQLSHRAAAPPTMGGRGRGSNQQERRPPRGRGRRGRNDSRNDYQYRSSNNNNPRDDTLEETMERLTIHKERQQYSSRPYRENKPPPRRENNNLQTETSIEGQRGVDNTANRPKRYSSLRQRSLPDNPSYPTGQSPVTTQYYETANYQAAVYSTAGAVPPQAVAPPPVQAAPLMNPFQGYSQPTYHQETFAIRAPMASPPRLFTPVTLPAGVAAPPVTYIAPPPANLMSYAAPPAPAVYPQYTFPQFPPSPVVPAAPPPAAVQERAPVSGPQSELFRGGITYYNTHSQQHMGRHLLLPQKRPKAAIPILPPPQSSTEEKDEMESNQSTVEVES